MASTFVHTPRYNPIARPPGYRYEDGQVDRRLTELLRQSAADMDLEITGLSIHPDHVHLQVLATPELAPSQIVYRFKVATAAALRSEFPELKKLPSMWNGSYLVSSDRELAQEDIDRYVEAHNKRA
jgi:putative transposase